MSKLTYQKVKNTQTLIFCVLKRLLSELQMLEEPLGVAARRPPSQPPAALCCHTVATQQHCSLSEHGAFGVCAPLWFQDYF